MAAVILEALRSPLKRFGVDLKDVDPPRASKKSRDQSTSTSAADIATSIKEANGLDNRSFIDRFVQPTDLGFTNKDGGKYDVSFFKSADLSESILKQCFDLIEETSSADYKAASAGWRPAEKQKEMREPDMRYLIVRLPKTDDDQAKDVAVTLESQGSDKPIAFLSCMLTIEDDEPVIYIYEIHLSSKARRSGLGRHLMSMAENIGRAAGMEKCMLTVFCSNLGAEAFYRSIGYEVDECSPQVKRSRSGKMRRPEYFIMSKEIQERS